MSSVCRDSYHLDVDMEQLKNSVETNETQLPGSQVVKSKEPAEDLIREIAVLELEVAYLEKYLLAMYRERFATQLAPLSEADDRGKGNSCRHDWMFSEFNKQDRIPMQKHSVARTSLAVPPLATVGNAPHKEWDDTLGATKLDDSSVLRCRSSLSHIACSFRTSPLIGALAEAVDSYHSLPMSLQRRAQESTSNVDDLCSIVSCRVHESPNWFSEEMVKCISALYCKLANPPLFSRGYKWSPTSFSSSVVESNVPGSQSGEPSSFRSWSDNPFHVEESIESSGHFVTAVDLRGLCLDDQSLNRVQHMLQRFRSLVSQMEQVDPRKMKHEEKLAFWINVHNALVMHAFLVYGIPRSNLKRVSLLLKAAYNIGGKTVSVEMIQSCILGCQLPRPGQWLQLFFPKQKLKSRDPRRAYAIEHQEPRLRFALCSGSHSDPVVRLYTPKRVLQDLEVAKEEYLQTNIRVYKEQKLLVPRNVECFVKEAGLCSSGLLEVIAHTLPEKFRKKFQQTDTGKSWKKIEWIPHSFSFRYLISKELAEGLLSA